MKNQTKDNRKKYSITLENYNYLKKNNLNNSDGVNALLKMGINTKEQNISLTEVMIKIDKRLQILEEKQAEIISFLLE